MQQRYGITLEEYNAKLEEQGGVCAICEEECKTGGRLDIDHSHLTGEVRGLLCRRCNLRLGTYELLEWRMKADLYLEDWDRRR